MFFWFLFRGPAIRPTAPITLRPRTAAGKFAIIN
jgi:hypothetical protein